MIERFFVPALTFSVLIAGHMAIAMAMFATPAAQPANQVASVPTVELPIVIVTAKRAS
ncbi:MAG: hypothetical protein H7Y33_00095 [Cytophagales bacterium]|nr:hypothetical protein [Rhizobacter sp.]